MSKIFIFAGSNGKNLELSNKVSEYLNSKDIENKVIDLASLNLPLYTNTSAKAGVPEVVKEICLELQSIHTMFFFAPEYNGGLPPVFTNFMAWASASSKDWRESFNGKSAIIGTHSGSGGLHALMALRIQLSYVGMNVFGRQIHTHYKKELNLEGLESIVKSIS